MWQRHLGSVGVPVAGVCNDAGGAVGCQMRGGVIGMATVPAVYSEEAVGGWSPLRLD